MRTLIASLCYSFAHFNFLRANEDAAQSALQKVLSFNSQHIEANSRLGTILLERQQWEEALRRLNIAAARLPTRASLHYKRGKCLAELGRPAEAAIAFETAIAASPDVAPYHYRLALVQKEQGKLWQAVESLRRAVELDPTRPDWHSVLGEYLYAMNRFDLAAASLRVAVTKRPKRFPNHYLLGLSLERAGLEEEADQAYCSVVKDSDKDVKRFGIGAVHHDRGMWPEARRAYQNKVDERPFDAELRYRLGMACDRMYQWPSAVQHYEQAVALNPKRSEWHYRLGFVHERMKNWTTAAAAYDDACSTASKTNTYWLYRRAYCLQMAGEYVEAVHAYLRADEKCSSQTAGIENFSGGSIERARTYAEIASLAVQGRPTRSEHWRKLGEALEQLGDWSGAARAYQSALDREAAFDPSTYYRLGVVLAKDGEHQQACEAFRQTRLYQGAYGVYTTKYQTSEKAKSDLEYCEFLETLPLRDNVILFESFHGKSVSCNPRAILDRVLVDERFSGFLIVLAANTTDIDQRYLADPRVVIVPRESYLYRRHLATAKFLINNNTFPPYFVRRDGQQYLNTWHGVPIKTLGKAIKSGFMEHKNASRNFLQATHMISPNRHTTDALIKGYDIEGLYSGAIAETGYPRVDATITPSIENLQHLRAKLRIDPAKKTVLYAPTWRGDLQSKKFDVAKLESDIAKLAALDINLLFRGHGETEALLKKANLPIAAVPSEIDSNDLLGVVDVLVTDYSSIAFDFMALGRPLAFYGHDIEEYERERGFLLHPRDLSDVFYLCIDDLVTAIVANEVPVPRADLVSRFCKCDDGEATRRTMDFFFWADRTHVVDVASDKENILFYGGLFLVNGITTSLVSLVNSIDKSRYNVAVVVDSDVVGSFEDRRSKFADLADDVHTIGRMGTPLGTPEEKWVFSQFTRNNDLPSPQMWEIMRIHMKREFRRCFGGAAIGTVVDFEGYGRFWAALFGLGSDERSRKIIYLHNEMENEWKEKYPYLSGTFRTFNFYDKIVSASESVSFANSGFLTSNFGLQSNSFDFSDNVIIPETIAKKGLEPLPENIETWVGGSKLFISVGRLMPEKDHRKLINAFASLNAAAADIKLLILGEGPLQAELQKQVDDLGLRDVVLLPGAVSNPMPAMKRADCFVLSSNYEGQGLVLIEALILGIPVISTDVVGPRSVLSPGYGLLVENSENGLKQGMQAFLDGRLSRKPFSGKRYQTESLQKFYDLLPRESPRPSSAVRLAICA